MSVLDRLHMPRHLSSRVWLLTIPTALISFERQQAMPKLPIGVLRFAGLPLIAGGLALAVWAWRNPEAAIRYNGPGARLSAQPATLAGLLVVAGAGLLLRSPVLVLYTLGLAAAATTETLEVDEPRPADFLGGRAGG
jgi:protein-S-isoprenylcysteine O-methyltransferase Ste14